MADQLEEENPGCFDDPDHTFIDLYVNLLMTEVTSLCLPCGQTTLFSASRIRVAAH